MLNTDVKGVKSKTLPSDSVFGNTLQVDNRHQRRPRSYERSRDRSPADDPLSRRALPPLPNSSTLASSKSEEDLRSDYLQAPPLPGRKGRNVSESDNIPLYVNVQDIKLPPRAKYKTPPQITVNEERDVSSNGRKGMENELANVLNARLKKTGNQGGDDRSKNKSGDQRPTRPPPPKR